MIKLQVLIATYGIEGLQRIVGMKLPQLEDVEYLVSCQIPGQSTPKIPSDLIRDDIRISFSASCGLSRNRNLLLRLATAPFCLIADDDIKYTPEALYDVIRTFDKNPDITIATFMYSNETGKPEKRYPNFSFDLRHPVKGYYPSSIELAFRKDDIKREEIYFNENFGVGTSRYLCGEEELWINDLLKRGVSGRFFPIMLARHTGLTSGVRNAGKPGILRAQGVVIQRLYPITSLLRILLKAKRSSRISSSSFGHCLKYLLQGWVDAIFKRRRLFSD